MRQHFLSWVAIVSLLVVSLAQTSRVNAQDQILREASFDWQDPESGNPLMGYALQAEKSQVDADVQLLYVDVTWKELEPGLDWLLELLVSLELMDFLGSLVFRSKPWQVIVQLLCFVWFCLRSFSLLFY